MNNNLISRCCWAEIETKGIPDFVKDSSVVTQNYVCSNCNEATMPIPEGSREYQRTADVCTWARMTRVYDDKGKFKVCGMCVLNKKPYCFDVVRSICSSTYQKPIKVSPYPTGFLYKTGKQKKITKGGNSGFASKETKR
jgi:hypothetical protein